MISKPRYIVKTPILGDYVVTQELFLGLAHEIGLHQDSGTQLNIRIQDVDYIFERVIVETLNLEVVYRMLLSPAPTFVFLNVNLNDPYLKG